MGISYLTFSTQYTSTQEPVEKLKIVNRSLFTVNSTNKNGPEKGPFYLWWAILDLNQ
jgi:hypothetical protein